MQSAHRANAGRTQAIPSVIRRLKAMSLPHKPGTYRRHLTHGICLWSLLITEQGREIEGRPQRRQETGDHFSDLPTLGWART